jgi:predicted AlkP superfamily phosphohydrolase/phosphomutase
MDRMSKNRKRVLVIGLDGATPELLFPWAKEKKLPNLSRLIEKGTSGPLQSTIPPTTAPAWVSFMTGKNPGKHGVGDFFRRIPDTYKFNKADRTRFREGLLDLSVINSLAVGSQVLWDILSKNNKKVGVLHVPITYPPIKVNGFIVSGLGTPGATSDFTYPSALKERLINDFKYKMHVTELDVDRDEEKTRRDLFETEQKRGEVAKALMKEFDSDFFMVVFEGIDIVQHYFWKYMDSNHPQHEPSKAKKFKKTVLDVYIHLDRIIGELLKEVDDDTTVIVISDHGGGPLHKKFCINKWLVGLDLLKLKERSLPIRFSNKVGSQKGKIRSLILKVGLSGLIKKIPINIRESIPDLHLTVSDFDFTKTKAFSYGGWGFIFINLEDREPSGTVKPGKEYEELRDFIIKELNKVKDPITGLKIVENVYKREDVYFGESVDQLPDLIVMLRETIDAEHIIPASENLFLSPPVNKSGNHRKNGVFIIHNKKFINKRKKVKNAEIIDVTPTILYVLGVPVSPSMDGKVLKTIFKDTYLKDYPIRYSGKIAEQKKSLQHSLSPADEEKVKERLRNLGYI